MKIIPKCNKTKRHLCASGSILLPLAQKWGLVGAVVICALSVLGARSASAASLSISVPGNLSVDVQPGGPAKESTSVGFTITSDAYWGYTLSVKSNDENGALTNGNSKINSIDTGITSLGQFTNNTWGFKVSGEGVTDSNSYRQGPTTTTTNLATTTGKKSGQKTGTYSFTLAAKVDNTIPTGTYTGTFTFIATANEVKYKINYDDNDGTSGPGIITGQTPENSIKLSNLEPKKSTVDHEYTFLGWCDQPVSTDGTCDGTIYQPNNDYEIKTDGQETTLYAMWDWIAMQNWDDCPKNLMKNKQFTLVDSRDNKPYYVAKLADNNCWMTENLDYDIVAGETLTAETTDLGYATDKDKNGEPGVYQWTPNLSTYKNVSTWNNTRAGASGIDASEIGDFISQSYDPGDYCWNGDIKSMVNGYTFPNDNVVKCEKHKSVDNSDPHYHVGNYYSFTAAVAQNDSSNRQENDGSFSTSICPAGWQLPEYSGNKSYKNLIDHSDPSITTNTSAKPPFGNIYLAPYYFAYIGLWRGDTSYGLGINAHYRTNSITNAQLSGYFQFANNVLSPQNRNGYRCDGFAVRCVARE